MLLVSVSLFNKKSRKNTTKTENVEHFITFKCLYSGSIFNVYISIFSSCYDGLTTSFFSIIHTNFAKKIYKIRKKYQQKSPQHGITHVSAMTSS